MTNSVGAGKRDHNGASSTGQFLRHCQPGDEMWTHFQMAWRTKCLRACTTHLPVLLVFLFVIADGNLWLLLGGPGQAGIYILYAQQMGLIEWVHKGELYPSLSPPASRMKEKAKEKKSTRTVGREYKQQKQRSSGLETQVGNLDYSGVNINISSGTCSGRTPSCL